MMHGPTREEASPPAGRSYLIDCGDGLASVQVAYCRSKSEALEILNMKSLRVH